MSAELLRRAAQRLRERAEAATTGRWIVLDMDDGTPDPVNVDGWWWVWAEDRLPHYGGIFEPAHSANCRGDAETCCHKSVGSGEITDGSNGAQERADVEHIAALDPTVAIALAELLEKTAEDLELDDDHDGFDSSVYTAAMGLARKYLREEE